MANFELPLGFVALRYGRQRRGHHSHFQIARLGRLGLDLLAQIRDLVVHHALRDGGFLVPHFVDEDAARQPRGRDAGRRGRGA
jgi:hypothetical protein